MSEESEDIQILLVDDDEEILVAMETALKHLPLKLDRATNGNKAIDQIEKLRPELIVLDMMLPKKSGFLVMDRIRKYREGDKSGKPFVIMVTGNTGQRHKEYAKTLGINEYINKPFRMDRLVQAVGKLLDIPVEE